MNKSLLESYTELKKLLDEAHYAVSYNPTEDNIDTLSFRAQKFNEFCAEFTENMMEAIKLTENKYN